MRRWRVVVIALLTVAFVVQAAPAAASTLRVVQVTRVSNDPQDFTFHAGPGLSPATFVLDDDGTSNNELPSAHSFLGIAPGTYSVTQDTPPGWEPADVTCSDGSPPSAIDLANGEDVTCTFSSLSSDAALVQFQLDAQPDSSQIFTFRGLTFPIFLNDDGSGTPETPSLGGMYVRPRMFTVSEGQVSGWLVTSATCSDGSPVWALDVQANEHVVCTFINQAAATGRVTVRVDTEPGDPQIFDFTASGGLNGVQFPPQFQLRDPAQGGILTNKVFQVAPGTGYGVSQALVSGFALVATCDDGSPISNIAVSAGENVTCTFENGKPGSLTIKHDTAPNDAQDFLYSISGGLSPSTFTLDDDGDDSNGTSSTQSFTNVPATFYSLQQQPEPGWSRYIGMCSNGSSIDNIRVRGVQNTTCFVRNVPAGTPPPASSVGAGGTPANAGTSAVAMSPDGRYVAFTTDATNLDPADGDAVTDVYWRDLRTGDTRLVSRATGRGGAKSNGNSLRPAISADGRYVAFDSLATNLSPDDTDSNFDVYVRDVATAATTLVNRATGIAGAKGSNGMSASISGDGRYIAFRDNAGFDPADIDSAPDIYVRDLQANTTTLVSRASGLAGADGDQSSIDPSISSDGRYVAFSSGADNLSPADPDTTYDVFVRDLVANTTTLASRATGANGAKGTTHASIPSISADGRYVAFMTEAQFDPGDTGSTTLDVYVRDLQGSTTTWATPENSGGVVGSFSPGFMRLSADGRYVAFSAVGPNALQAYLRDLQTQTTTLISRTSGDTASGDNATQGVSVSSGGRFVAFLSAATNLAPDDVPLQDLYVRDTAESVTSLESRGSPTYARPKGATPMFTALVPAYDTCGSPNRQHGAPLVVGSCAPPVRSSQRLTVGTPDANGQPVKSLSTLKAIVLPGAPATPQDEADIQFTASVTDVRNDPGLADYSGELEVRVPLQVTDRISYPPAGGQGPGTTVPFDLSFAIPCAGTADTTIGASCDLVTTADTILPGAATESSRGVWQWGQVSVYDGGPDSDADTQIGNSPFLRQGIFVP